MGMTKSELLRGCGRHGLMNEKWKTFSFMSILYKVLYKRGVNLWKMNRNCKNKEKQ